MYTKSFVTVSIRRIRFRINSKVLSLMSVTLPSLLLSQPSNTGGANIEPDKAPMATKKSRL
jgi:hypothetical protein